MREITNEHRPVEVDRKQRSREEPAPPEAPKTPKPPERSEPPETAREPAPGIEHEPEPDGENIVPIKDRPGTL